MLKTSNSDNVRNMGSELEGLKEMREDSDYRVKNYQKTSGNFKSTAEIAFYMADGLINDLSIINKPETDIDLSRFNISP